MDNQEQRLRDAIAALHRFAQDPKNQLLGPKFSELLDEFDLARDGLLEAQESPDPMSA